MKDEKNIYYNQRIECDVLDCKYCNCEALTCTLGSISVCKNYNNVDEKENTLCNSYVNKNI